MKLDRKSMNFDGIRHIEEFISGAQQGHGPSLPQAHGRERVQLREAQREVHREPLGAEPGR